MSDSFRAPSVPRSTARAVARFSGVPQPAGCDQQSGPLSDAATGRRNTWVSCRHLWQPRRGRDKIPRRVQVVSRGHPSHLSPRAPPGAISVPSVRERSGARVEKGRRGVLSSLQERQRSPTVLRIYSLWEPGGGLCPLLAQPWGTLQTRAGLSVASDPELGRQKGQFQCSCPHVASGC